jgi:hypothetical protein
MLILYGAAMGRDDEAVGDSGGDIATRLGRRSSAGAGGRRERSR